MSEQKVTVEQVLRDALHHIRMGWVRHSEIEKKNGAPVKGRPYTTSPKTRKQLEKLVEEGVNVCAIGGIMLARTLLNGEGQAKQAHKDPVTQQAYRVLAYAIDPVRVAESDEEPEGIIVRFNDSVPGIEHWTQLSERRAIEKKHQRRVIRAFEKAIKLAEGLGL